MRRSLFLDGELTVFEAVVNNLTEQGFVLPQSYEPSVSDPSSYQEYFLSLTRPRYYFDVGLGVIDEIWRPYLIGFHTRLVFEEDIRKIGALLLLLDWSNFKD